MKLKSQNTSNELGERRKNLMWKNKVQYVLLTGHIHYLFCSRAACEADITGDIGTVLFSWRVKGRSWAVCLCDSSHILSDVSCDVRVN